MRQPICLLLLAMLITACGNSESDTWSKPLTTTLSCADYLALPTGKGVLYNNVWNQQAAGSGNWHQCLEKSLYSRRFGWSWRWPEQSNEIFAYPQIKIGVSPWDPGAARDERFPLDISTLTRLNIAHQLEISTNGQHNVATSMWLVDSPLIGDQPAPELIAAEVMIWTYATEHHLSPAGVMVDTLETNGSRWEVWVEKNWTDPSRVNDKRWIYLSFRSLESALTAEYDALELLQFAIHQNYLPDGLYLADIELGTEIRSGSGLAWVDDFRVDIH